MRTILAVLVGLAASTGVLPAATPERLDSCLACHGEDGQSKAPEIPSLGAQPPQYVLIQLYMFREKLRAAGPMNDLVKGLNAQGGRARFGARPKSADRAPALTFQRGTIATARSLRRPRLPGEYVDECEPIPAEPVHVSHALPTVRWLVNIWGS